MTVISGRFLVAWLEIIAHTNQPKHRDTDYFKQRTRAVTTLLPWALAMISTVIGCAWLAIGVLVNPLMDRFAYSRDVFLTFVDYSYA